MGKFMGCHIHALPKIIGCACGKNYPALAHSKINRIVDRLFLDIAVIGEDQKRGAKTIHRIQPVIFIEIVNLYVVCIGNKIMLRPAGVVL